MKVNTRLIGKELTMVSVEILFLFLKPEIKLSHYNFSRTFRSIYLVQIFWRSIYIKPYIETCIIMMLSNFTLRLAYNNIKFYILTPRILAKMHHWNKSHTVNPILDARLVSRKLHLTVQDSIDIKPQSHIHGFGPGRATVYPDLASR